MNTKTAALKRFSAIQRNIKRVYDSASYKYWVSHEEETADGWWGDREYPYRRSAERAYERADELEEEAFVLYENASDEERDAMENADECYLVSC